MPDNIADHRPDLGRREVGRHRQPVGAARLHAGAEPGRPVRASAPSDAGCTAPGSGRRPRTRSTRRSTTRTTTRIRPPIHHRSGDPCNLDDQRPGSTRPTRSASRRRSRPRRTSRWAWRPSTTRRSSTARPTRPRRSTRRPIATGSSTRPTTASGTSQWYVADPTTGTLSEVALKSDEVAAAQNDPNVFPTPDTTKSPAGPSWIQIGTEGGFLPAPAVVPPADHLDHRPDALRLRQRRPARAAAGAGRAGRRDRRLLPVPGQDADPVQRRPGGLPGRAGQQTTTPATRPDAGRRCRPRCPATGPTPARSCR